MTQVFFQAESEDWLDCAVVQLDLSPRCMHMLEGRVSKVAAIIAF